MKKTWLFVVLLAVMLLTACGQQAPATATPAPSAPPTQPADPTPGAVSTDTAASGGSNCTVVSGQIVPDPTITAIFPPPTDKDWSYGSPNARVTILDYSDFQ